MYILPRRLHITVCLVLGAEGSPSSALVLRMISRGGLCIVKPRDCCLCCPLAVVDVASNEGSFQGVFIPCSVVFLFHGGQWRGLRIT